LGYGILQLTNGFNTLPGLVSIVLKWITLLRHKREISESGAGVDEQGADHTQPQQQRRGRHGRLRDALNGALFARPSRGSLRCCRLLRINTKQTYSQKIHEKLFDEVLVKKSCKLNLMGYRT
jgi:hypothetical protein